MYFNLISAYVKRVILAHYCVHPPPMNTIKVVAKPQEELDIVIEIDHWPKVSGWVNNYFACHKEHRSTKLIEIYRYEDLIA